MTRRKQNTQPSSENPQGPTPPQITDAELVVMKTVWDKAPVTANQVVAAMEVQSAWRPKTIHTLLRRLVEKGAVEYEKKGREFLFRPRISSEEYAHQASRSFLGKLFDGEIAPFLSCFLEREELSANEIAELRRLLDGKKP